MGKKKSAVVLEEVTDDTRCGIGCINGSCCQFFATKKWYLVAYTFLGLFQSMFFSYSIATLTTLEKQFKLKSQTTGILLSGNECSQILLSLVITYWGGQGHRPRLAALGVIFSGFSSILIVIPHFVYGKSSPLVNGTRNLDVCELSPSFLTPSLAPVVAPECADYTAPIGPMVYIFMSQFISGIGTTLFSILGITYLDDNVKRKQTPMLIGLMSAVRLIGPALGYGLAGFCIRMYVNLGEKTTLKPTDPAWIGAWWLGLLVIGIAQLSTWWLLALFPRRLPKPVTLLRGPSTRSTSSTVATKPKARTMKEFPAALRRLLTNKILMFNNISAVFFVFALSGYLTFLPKFIETQYQQSAAFSGVVNGGSSILFMCTGLIIAGCVISRFRPSAVKLQMWDVGIGILWAALMVTFSFVSCDSKPIHGLDQMDPDAGPMMGMLPTSCNMDCNCQANRFAPACSEDGKINFFSACHAGCRTMNFTNGKNMFSDCSCIKEWRNSTVDDPFGSDGEWVDGKAIGGYCPSNCFTIFLVYILAMGVVKFLSSAGRVSNVIIGFRCVPPEDKSFAIGLGYLLISLFAFIPAPIVYGAVIDKACILWRTDKCGERGNCWIYDPEKMRLYLHMLSAIFIVIGSLLNCFVVYYVRGLDLYNEDEESAVEEDTGNTVNGKANHELQPMLATTTRLPLSLTEDELMKTLEA